MLGSARYRYRVGAGRSGVEGAVGARPCRLSPVRDRRRCRATPAPPPRRPSLGPLLAPAPGDPPVRPSFARRRRRARPAFGACGRLVPALAWGAGREG